MRPAAAACAALLLASCGAPTETNRAENEQAAAPAVSDSSSGVPAANQAVPAATETEPAPTVAAAIPAAFRGSYDETEEACAQPSQAKLNVSATELRFHESIGTVRSVKVEAPDRIEVLADYQGEGESWQNVRRMQLDGKRLTISGEGTEMVRVRCPAAKTS